MMIFVIQPRHPEFSQQEAGASLSVVRVCVCVWAFPGSQGRKEMEEAG